MSKAVGLIVLVLSVAASQAAPGLATARRQDVPMFGFEVGEERRYVLGPPGALIEGESVVWTIKLAQTTENGGRLFAAFDLGLDSRWLPGPAGEEVFGRSVRARLIVNDAGFPGAMTVFEQLNDTTLVTTYAVQADGTIRMEIGWPDNEFVVPIPIPPHANLDLPNQAGLFLFDGRHRPTERRTSPSETSRASGDTALPPYVSPGEWRVWEPPDGGRYDSLFFNPGLLSLALPREVSAGEWQLEFLAFGPRERMPRFPDGELMSALGRPRGVQRGFFFDMRLRGEGAEQIDIGGRTIDAIRIRIGETFRRSFVDANGRVLLIEPEALDGRSQRHIRLLWPSEY